MHFDTPYACVPEGQYLTQLLAFRAPHISPEAQRTPSRIPQLPTAGWTFKKSGGLETRTEGNATVYGIPYSEHSSFTELRACVAALRPQKLVPTVNAANPAAARAVVDRFADLMDLSRDRSRLDMYFGARSRSSGCGLGVLYQRSL